MQKSVCAPAYDGPSPGPWRRSPFTRQGLLLGGLIVAVCLALTAPSPASAASICIDPGHGGPYSNANANGLQEKTVNLQIAKALRDELRSRGHEVTLTRYGDHVVGASDRPTWNWSDTYGWRFFADGTTRYSSGVPKDDLQARCDKANAAGSDIFISIHNNGSASSSAHGTENYASRRDPLGQKLSEYVQQEVVRETGLYDRGALDAEFYVIRWTNMPAILVEGGFITNASDARLLSSSSFRRRLARGIARGVARFLDTDPFKPVYPRLAGPDRFATAADVSLSGWPDGAGKVLLTSGLDWPDAMTAAPLSRKLDAPLLLTWPDRLDPSTAEELRRLSPDEVIVLGSEQAVASHVATAAVIAAGDDVGLRRIGGRDRYETAVMVAGEVGVPPSGQVTLVSGSALVDALSIVPGSSAAGSPILLTKRDELPKVTSRFFSENATAVASTLVVGGPPVIGETPLAGLPSVTRISGADRYRTNVAVLNRYYGSGSLRPFLVNCYRYSDGLVAAAVAAKTGQPIALTGGRFLSPYTREWLVHNRSRVSGWTVVGGPPAVPYLMDWMVVKSSEE